MSPHAVPFLEATAQRYGLRYEPDADERWLRAWEPFTTLRVPHRYEHALHGTWGEASLSLARAVVETTGRGADGAPRTYEVSTWIAIGQDTRLAEGRVAVASDAGSPFAEASDLVPWARHRVDPTFDATFATFAPSPDDVARALTPSLRRLLVGFRTPLHAEVRPGGFVLAPVRAGADASGLAWSIDAARLFAEKAAKRV